MVESKNSSHDENVKYSGKRKTFYLLSVVFFCGGAVAVAIGRFLPEIVELSAAFLLSGAIYFLLNTQRDKLKRSTIYVLWCIITAFLGVLFLELGIHIADWLGNATLMYPFIAFFLALFAFAYIIFTGEIIKLSGIAKILLILLAAWMFGRLGVLELEMLRRKSSIPYTEQTQSQSTLSNGDQNDLPK